MNSFGHLFRLTTFGESHGEAIGGVIDGVPPGIAIDLDFIQSELSRRRPGQSSITTARQESDHVEFLSGIYQGRTTGTPIGFYVANSDQRSNDYATIATLFRPSHADYTYEKKYGLRDPRGGGRSSARITIARCVAGAIAKLILAKRDITVTAYTSQIGDIVVDCDYSHLDLTAIDSNAVRCPDSSVAERMIERIQQVQQQRDSIGGVVTGIIHNCPAGLGEPEFGKLHAQLAAAMMSINAAKGFDYGAGFTAATMTGSQHNDPFTIDHNGVVRTVTNHSGGIQGGISNGEDIIFRVAFKPTATIAQPQETVTTDGTAITFTAHGRHDPCVVPRAVPIVEAMAAIVILDNLLLNNAIHVL